MNRYVEAMFTVPHGYFKFLWIKLFHGKHFRFGKLPRVSRGAEFCVDRHTDVKVGEWFAIGRDASFRVRKNAKVILGKHVSFGDNCVLACHEGIAIGDDTQIASGAQIYDHDHDFRIRGGQSQEV